MSTDGEQCSIVVIVSHFPEPSQTFIVDHVRGLLQYGWTVHLATRSVNRGAVEALGFLDCPDFHIHLLHVSTYRQPLRRLFQLVATSGVTHASLLRSVNFRSAAYFASSLRTLLAEVRPALVHAHFAQNGLLAAVATGRQIPLIVNFHGYDVLDLPDREDWKAYRFILAGSHGVVHSSFLEDHVARFLDVRLHRVTLGVDLQLFQGATPRVAWEKPLRILMVGRIVPQKGHHFGIQAFSRIATARPDVDPRMTVVGEGPNRDHLEYLVSRQGLSDRVQFVGALSEKRVAMSMAASDILLVPSIPLHGWEESFCRVAIEGLSSGLAVIGTKTGGLAETISDGGYLVDPGEPDVMASTALSLLDSHSPDTISSRARRRAEAFDIVRMWKDYNDLSELVAGTG